MSKDKEYIETLYENPWVSLKQVVRPGNKIVKPGDTGYKYVFSHETRCNGQIVAILPYRYNNKKKAIEFLVRIEVTPCWGQQYEMSSITGGVEHIISAPSAVEELSQEAGYNVDIDDLIYLGVGYASKSSDTIYHLYSVNLTAKRRGKASGDGSSLEAEAYCKWVSKKELFKSKDPQIYVLLARLYEQKIIEDV
ncbi:MAG: hypothetical protein HQ538_00685 [Parcubacteria group bacterium]|nr:hypothetical protein [Parcubacteria group bacterium]